MDYSKLPVVDIEEVLGAHIMCATEINDRPAFVLGMGYPVIDDEGNEYYDTLAIAYRD